MATPRPTVIGVVNVTRDSFSDGGLYLDPQAAVARARAMLADGADAIELGAAASHPGAEPVGAAEEIARLSPILDALLAEEARVSIDSFEPATQVHCLRRGIAFLNDTRGFADASVYPALAAASCRLVVMHSVQGTGLATREATDAQHVLDGVYRFFDQRVRELEDAGIAHARLVLDPGMGFFLGSTAEPSILVLRNLRRLRERFELPVLVSVSRKSFLGAITGRGVDERGAATLAAELFAASQGVDYIRTHDTATLADALRVMRALTEMR